MAGYNYKTTKVGERFGGFGFGGTRDGTGAQDLVHANHIHANHIHVALSCTPNL